MGDLRQLYQEVVLDHGRKPRNRRRLGPPAVSADGHNPVCGDRVTVFVEADGSTVRDVAFDGEGCAISIASASMMTQALKGRSLDEAEAVHEAFHRLVTGELDPDRAEPTVGKLMVFAGVREFPVRVKCATLAWHTLRAALDRRDDAVTTERA